MINKDEKQNYLQDSIFHPYRFFTYTEAAKILRVSIYWMKKHAKQVIKVKRPDQAKAYISRKT